jgi:hypothetical protein
MLSKLGKVCIALILSCPSLIASTGHAAQFAVSTTDSYPAAPPATWNPRAVDGLIAVMSEATSVEYDGSYTDVIWTLNGAAHAATYGSDTSSGDGILDPRLKGYSIEPMADTQASASMECSRGGLPYTLCSGLSMHASAGASVIHRVIQRGDVAVSEELQSKLDKLDYVPTNLDYELSASASHADATAGRASVARSSFSMGALHVIVSADPDFNCPPNASCFFNEHSENMNLWLEPSTVDRTVPFVITASASVSAVVKVEALGDRIVDAWAQAVADPFLYVDPTWEYAQYFMVQQESLLNPGGWAEVTRVWQSGPNAVPEPETPALVLVGLGALMLATRARRTRQPSRIS